MALRVSHKAVAKKHTQDINSLVFARGRLYSGADDGKIKVWEEDLQLASETQAHEAPIFSLTASESSLYSCSNDATVKAWDLKSLQGRVLIKGRDEFWKVCYDNGYLYTGDDQGILTIFKGRRRVGEEFICDPIKDMAVCNNRVFTVRDVDLVITEFHKCKSNEKIECLVEDDDDTFYCECPKHHTEAERFKPVSLKTIMGRAPVTLFGDKFAFTSRSGRDIIVHENSKDTQFNLIADVKDAHEMLINALLGFERGNQSLLLSAGWEKCVKLWKVEKDHISLVDKVMTDTVVQAMTLGAKGEIYAGGINGNLFRLDIM